MAYLAISFGAGVGGWISIAKLLNDWFSRWRAFAMSVTAAGAQLGGFLLPLLTRGIENYDFRMTSLGIGIVLIVVAIPASRLIRNLPEDMGLRPDGEPRHHTEYAGASHSVSEPTDANEMTLGQALRTAAFWVIAVARLTSSVLIATVSLHLVSKLTDSGISMTTADFVVTIYTFVAFLSGLVAGYLADRTSKVIVLFVCMLVMAFAMGILTVTDTLPMAVVFAVLWGAGIGGRLPLLTAITGDFFGRKRFGAILGINMALSSIPMIFGPLFAGYMYDLNRSYFIPFATFTIIGFIGAFVILLARRPSSPAEPT